MLHLVVQVGYYGVLSLLSTMWVTNILCDRLNDR